MSGTDPVTPVFVAGSGPVPGTMDAQAQARGGIGAWPAFPGVEIAGIARCLGCAAIRVQTHEQLLSALDEALADPAARTQPLLIEVGVAE